MFSVSRGTEIDIEQPDSEKKIVDNTKCYPLWDLNSQHLSVVESGVATA